MSLSEANKARLDKALNKTYRFDTHTDNPIICTLQENERKTTYQAYFKDDSFLDIPKMVYEYYVNELGKPVKNK